MRRNLLFALVLLAVGLAAVAFFIHVPSFKAWLLAQASSPSLTNDAGFQPGQELVWDLGHGVKMALVQIPAGEFTMGSRDNETHRYPNEGPPHKVQVPHPFYMGKFAVTNRQYRCFKPDHDSGTYRGLALNGDDQPVVEVSWDEAQAFCRWLSEKSGWLVNLPSEAEWEHVARGHDSRQYVWGNEWPPPVKAGNFADLSAKKSLPEVRGLDGYDDGFAGTAPVGSFRPNPYGIYDLAGNVWQWCRDVYHDNYQGAPTDGTAWDGNSAARALRGGSWESNYSYRPSNRQRYMQFSRNEDVGFRVVAYGPQDQTAGTLYANTSGWSGETLASEQQELARPVPEACPVPWQAPSSQPAPCERIRGADWRVRYEQALRTLTPANKADSGIPPLGMKIIEVVSDSRADCLGISPGDCLLAIDDVPITNSADFARYRLDRPQTFKIWSARSGIRSLAVPGGELGFMCRPQWLPGVAYRHSKDRDPAWDDLLLVAAKFWKEDEALAETALYHAARAGYRGWLTPALMAGLTQEHGRCLEALDWGFFARQAVPAEYRLPMDNAFFMAALASGRLDLARQTNQQDSEHLFIPESFDLERKLREFSTLTAEQKQLPSPCLAASRLETAPQKLQGLDSYGDKSAQWYNEQGSLAFKCIYSRPSQSTIGPTAKNLGVTIDFRFTLLPWDKPNTPQDPKSGELIFSLTNATNGFSTKLINVHFRDDHLVDIQPFRFMGIERHSDRLSGSGINRLEMGILGPWCEVRLNGRRVYLGIVPDDAERNLACTMQVSCVEGHIYRFRLKNLDSLAPALVSTTTKPVPSTVPAEPLVIPPPPKDPALAWYHNATVQGYLQHGRRNPAWDAAAVKALAGDVFIRDGDYEKAEASLAECRKAMAAGCDDPAVVSACANVGFMDDTLTSSLIQFHRQAADQITATAYAPLFKALLLDQAMTDALDASLNQIKAEGPKRIEALLTVLPAALADPQSPNKYLLEVLNNVVDKVPAEKVRPTEVLEKVTAMIEKARPGSILIPLVKGHFYIEAAWKARGKGWANTVTEEGWKWFGQHLQTAEECLETAWKQDPTDPAAPTMMLTVALGSEKAGQDVEEWLERAMKNDPNNYDAGLAMLWSLRPRWGGSWKQMLAFGRQCRNRARKESLSPKMMLLLIDAHKGITDDLKQGDLSDLEIKLAQGEYWRSPGVWQELQGVFEEILGQYPDSPFMRSMYANYACKCGHWDVAHEQFERLGTTVVLKPFGSTAEMTKLRARAQNEVRAAPKR